jgi:hypothetical protein
MEVTSMEPMESESIGSGLSHGKIPRYGKHNTKMLRSVFPDKMLREYYIKNFAINAVPTARARALSPHAVNAIPGAGE